MWKVHNISEAYTERPCKRIHLCNSRVPFWAYFRNTKVYKARQYNVYLAPTTARHLPLNCITGFKWEIYAGAFFGDCACDSFFQLLSQTGELASHFSSRSTFIAAMTLILELRSRLCYYHHIWSGRNISFFEIFRISSFHCVCASAVQCTTCILLGPLL